MSSNSLEFSRFVDAAETMENESGKLAKIEHSSDLLGIAGADVGIAARFIQGDIFPAWDNRKVSVGSVLVYKALAESSGLTRDEIESRVADVGDPGLVCEQLDIESDSGQVTQFGKGQAVVKQPDVRAVEIVGLPHCLTRHGNPN